MLFLVHMLLSLVKHVSKEYNLNKNNFKEGRIIMSLRQIIIIAICVFVFPFGLISLFWWNKKT